MLASGGILYLLLALFGDIDSPLFGILLMVLVGHELLHSHLSRR
jgi:hypothetical protein